MTRIHIIGSGGFIGKAIKHEAVNSSLQCWSHNHSEADGFFDLLNSKSWSNLLDQHPTNVVLLSWPGLPNYNEHFHVTRNLPACIELIEQLANVGLKRIVVAGTCYEYGLQNGPLREDQLTDPINCYAIAKDGLRRVLASRSVRLNFNWCWARIFYPFGNGQNPNSLLPSLQRSIDKAIRLSWVQQGQTQ